MTHCSIGKNATRAHGKCQQAFLDAANKQNLTFLVQVRRQGLDTWNVLSAGACTASRCLCRCIFCLAVIEVNLQVQFSIRPDVHAEVGVAAGH